MVVVALLAPVLILAAMDRRAVERQSPFVQEVVVSDRDVSYPLRDVLTFDYRPDEVFVYVSMQQVPEGAQISATVERSGRSSLVSRFFGRDSIEVEEVSSDLTPVGRDAGTVSGVVKLRLKDTVGDLRSGDYTVEVFMDGEQVATRGFEVGGV